MAAVSWANGITGNWNDKTKWDFGLVPTAADDATINNVGIFTVGVSTADVANSLTFDAVNGTLSESTTGSLTIGGTFSIEAGKVLLHHANSFGTVAVSGGLLALYAGSALGGASLDLTGGETTGMVSETVKNAISISGSSTILIDAATGTTLNLDATTPWGLDATSAPTLQFGSTARKGVVVWHTLAGSVITDTGNYAVDVAGGVLRAGDSSFGFLLQEDASTTVAAGGMIDLNGFSATIHNLQGGGAIKNAGASAALVVQGGVFSGVISGNLSVELSANTFFEGINTYAGATIIDSGQYLATGVEGSVAGAIIDNGSLFDEDSGGTFTTGVISGTGQVFMLGKGTLVLAHANTYSGGTDLSNGATLLGSGKGFGSGTVTVVGAKLFGTATETATNTLTLRGPDTLAAVTGTTLTLTGGSSMTWDAHFNPLNLTFGDIAHKGTVALGGTGSASVDSTNPITVKVAYGTLRAANNQLGSLLGGAQSVTVAAGATLDAGGHFLVTPGLACAGTITNSSVTLAMLITENTSTVTGAITGKLELKALTGTLKLTGTNTYTGGTTVANGANLTLSGTGSIKGSASDDGALTFQNTSPTTFSGVISGAGTVTQDGAGALTLSGANTYTGGTTVQKGELIVTNGKALGTNGLTLDNGAELLGAATMTLGATQTGVMTFNGVTTLAAAHGTVLTIGGGNVQVNAGTMNFGTSADDGVIVFKVTGGMAPGPFAMKINDGTLKAGDAVFGNLTTFATSVTVATGATLDLNGFSVTAVKLLGAGSVTDSGATAILNDEGGTFAGAITGRTKLRVFNTVILTGTSTYTGGTVIDSSGALQLGAGGATGSIAGAINDAGTLVIDRSGTLALTGIISGSGGVTQEGLGVTTLSGPNTYTGATTISRGELVSGRSAALGSGGTITMTGGVLLASATQTLTHDFAATGSVTLAAATGDTLVLTTGTCNLGSGKVYLGDATHAGTILLNVSTSITGASLLEIRDGTLKIGSGLAGDVLTNSTTVRIDTGATIDVASQSPVVHSLTGSGTLTNSGAGTTVALEGATDFAGVIAGHIQALEIFSQTTLRGNETFTGKAVFDAATSLTLSGLFGEDVEFTAAPETLVLAAPSRFTGTIEDFQSGSTIDLRNLSAGSSVVLAYNTSTGVLTVKQGAITDTLKFGSGLVLGNFAASSDGSGGTDISWQTPPPAAIGGPQPTTAPTHTRPRAVAKPPNPARLVDAIASLPAPHAAATLIVPPPIMQAIVAAAH
ncbi:MAG TPA: autotransporter-associated beta strand repeat-containing protein [Caulobacteraceae bacterium]|jgi:autotransporter-associated beta strand protein